MISFPLLLLVFELCDTLPYALANLINDTRNNNTIDIIFLSFICIYSTIVDSICLSNHFQQKQKKTTTKWLWSIKLKQALFISIQ